MTFYSNGYILLKLAGRCLRFSTIVATKVQMARGLRKAGKKYTRSPALQGNPQKRGRFVKLVIITPRKPNSAKRKVGKIRLSNGKRVSVKMPGKGNYPHKFAVVLVRGGGHRDTPGVGYSAIRGAMECMPLFEKRRKRSLYGNSKVEERI